MAIAKKKTGASKVKKENPLIKIRKLWKSFKVGNTMIPVLKGIDAEIYAGEFIIVFGPSGSGKSTLMNVMLGMEQPSTGKVWVKSKDIYAYGDDQRAGFRATNYGVVYQMPIWVKALSVWENVGLPLNIMGYTSSRAKNRALQMLDVVGMADFADYRPTALSGGQQQKVGLARSLVTNPSVLFADEPTGNLDSKSALEVMQAIQALNQKTNKTIILVTHNIDYQMFASRRISMEDGQIIDSDMRYFMARADSSDK